MALFTSGIWVIHWGLLLRLPWRTWVCPCEGQVWRWCSCFSHRDSGSTRYSGELGAKAAGNIVLWKGMAGEGDGTPLRDSCLEHPMDRGAWWAAVHGVAKSQTRLSNFPFTFPLHALEKEMATHSSVLAWRIPGMAEPSGLPSMGSHRVGHD